MVNGFFDDVGEGLAELDTKHGAEIVKVIGATGSAISKKLGVDLGPDLLSDTLKIFGWDGGLKSGEGVVTNKNTSKMIIPIILILGVSIYFLTKKTKK